MKKHKLDLYNKNYKEVTLKRNADSFNEFDWELISMKQTLSEEFIEKYQDKVSWIDISIFQKLSEEFIMKYFNNLIINKLKINQNISTKIKRELSLIQEII